jgi:outer membrane protein, multidrug efflux system
MRRGITLLITMASTLAVSGCATMAPEYQRPAAPVPASWPIGDAYLRQSEAALPTITYRDVFKDARLQTLIDQALANNRDLRAAAANIASARAQYRIQRADLLPQVDATARDTYTHRGSGAATTAGTGGTGTGAAPGFSGSSYAVNLGITAFELDLFGRIRSLTGAALDRYFATEAAARATRLTLVGDIASAWIDYAADKSLLKVAEDTAINAEKSVALTEARLNGGIAPRTDLRQAQQVLFTANADVAQQRTALAQDVNALQLLVGAPIDPALLPASIDMALPEIATLPAGLDSGILLRRPDVVQAEYQLRAANAQIGAARASLFPRISLTGLIGFASNALSSLFSGGAFNYSVAPSASYPIFSAGAGVANVRYSQAQRDAALANYEKSIQTAFQEVSDALAREGTITDQLTANRNFVDASGDTLKLTNARYRGGIDTFLTSLDAQRSYYNAQRTLIATERTAATNKVTLYRVLGGDSLLDATSEGPQPTTP